MATYKGKYAKWRPTSVIVQRVEKRPETIYVLSRSATGVAVTVTVSKPEGYVTYQPAVDTRRQSEGIPETPRTFSGIGGIVQQSSFSNKSENFGFVLPPAYQSASSESSILPPSVRELIRKKKHYHRFCRYCRTLLEPATRGRPSHSLRAVAKLPSQGSIAMEIGAKNSGSSAFNELKEKNLDLWDSIPYKPKEKNIQAVIHFLYKECQPKSKYITDVYERAQLRKMVHYWSNFLRKHRGRWADIPLEHV